MAASRPRVVLPAPMKPIRATWRPSAFRCRGATGTVTSASRNGDALGVGTVRGGEVAAGVAPELLVCGDGELPGHCRLRHHREGFDRPDVRPLDERGRRLARG